ncbi:unnamed protein product [Phyllotreta striolata]|uniref:Uncharacterized protein n=1 Tax=Phyllotreta striolata TaxID=444603 RepID=A0A9N9TU44_PHYSR|nr:unnamed protein product [Phyllotreta striolata]
MHRSCRRYKNAGRKSNPANFEITPYGIEILFRNMSPNTKGASSRQLQLAG